jgi:hypothetical protein
MQRPHRARILSAFHINRNGRRSTQGSLLAEGEGLQVSALLGLLLDLTDDRAEVLDVLIKRRY